MTTFKQILAGCMTAGLILGSLPMMGGDFDGIVSQWAKQNGRHIHKANGASNESKKRPKPADKLIQNINYQPAAKSIKYESLMADSSTTFGLTLAAFASAYATHLSSQKNILGGVGFLGLTCALAYRPYVFGQHSCEAAELFKGSRLIFDYYNEMGNAYMRMSMASVALAAISTVWAFFR